MMSRHPPHCISEARLIESVVHVFHPLANGSHWDKGSMHEILVHCVNRSMVNYDERCLTAIDFPLIPDPLKVSRLFNRVRLWLTAFYYTYLRWSECATPAITKRQFSRRD